VVDHTPMRSVGFHQAPTSSTQLHRINCSEIFYLIVKNLGEKESKGVLCGPRLLKYFVTMVKVLPHSPQSSTRICNCLKLGFVIALSFRIMITSCGCVLRVTC